MNNALKVCKICGCGEFNSRGSCRQCVRKATQEWRRNNPEKNKESLKKSREKRKEKIRAKMAKYRSENKEKIREQSRDYYVKNAELLRSKSKAYAQANPEKRRKGDRAWRLKNPDKVKATDHAYRARKSGAGGRISPGLKDLLFKLQKGKCPCCGKPLGDNFQLDHIIALASGGSNSDYNIQLLRASCNSSKRDRHPIDFMQSRGFLL